MPESNDIRSPFGKKSLLTFFSHRPATPGTHMRVRGAWGASGELAEGSIRALAVVSLCVGRFRSLDGGLCLNFFFFFFFFFFCFGCGFVFLCLWVFIFFWGVLFLFFFFFFNFFF